MFLQRIVVALALVFSFASAASATTYYVRTDGNNANAGTANTAGGAWRTITKGCSTAVAGDTVRVQAGTYLEAISGCTSGTSGNTVTTVADGAVTTCSLSFSSKSYIRIVGITFDPSTGGCSSGTAVTMSGTNTGLEFWNVSILNNLNNKAVDADFGSSNRCDKCIWIGGSIHDIGTSGGGLIGMLISGNDLFVGYMDFQRLCYVGIGPAGARGRYVNNNFSELVACAATHPDNFYIASYNTLAFSTSLVESVFNLGTPAFSNNKFHHQQNESTSVWADNIYRLNVSYNLGGGVMSLYNNAGAGGNLRTREYHNTWVKPERAQSVTGCESIGSGATTGLYSYNNIYYQCQSPGISTNIAVWAFGSGTTSALLFTDYNLAFDPDATDTFTAQWTGQAHEQTNVNPNFVDAANLDFHLGAGSGSGANARGTGGPLTTATSCSGTTLNVASLGAAFFIGDNSANLSQYGGKLAPGDTITVGASTTRTIASIAGDAITVDSSLTCSASDPVYFGSTSTPDIGASPYKAGGYTLSAGYTIGGGTATITPNDPSLVRFVVCYNDNVPYEVSNSAPYACAVPTGAFSATVYPRYASQTQSVAAIAAASGGTPRLRIRIRTAALPSTMPVTLGFIGWRIMRRRRTQ